MNIQTLRRMSSRGKIALGLGTAVVGWFVFLIVAAAMGLSMGGCAGKTIRVTKTDADGSTIAAYYTSTGDTNVDSVKIKYDPKTGYFEGSATNSVQDASAVNAPAYDLLGKLADKIPGAK